MKELSVNINFDEASKAWRLNKKYMSNGVFNYTCEYVYKNKNKCKCNNLIHDHRRKLNEKKHKFESYKNYYCNKHFTYLCKKKLFQSTTINM